MTVTERDAAPPPVTVKQVPTCASCRSTSNLVLGDGPAVCRICIYEAGQLGRATVRRNDTNPLPDDGREGRWDR